MTVENLSIKVLKAGFGDAILIHFLDHDNMWRNILIDGGNNKREYSNYLKIEILEIQRKGQFIDLLVITHTDQDHIKGVYYLLQDLEIDQRIIKEIWFNSFDNSLSPPASSNEISYVEACNVQYLINKLKIKRRNDVHLPLFNRLEFHGVQLTLFSPNYSDIELLKSKNDNEPNEISAINSDYHHSIEDLVRLNTDIFVKGIEDIDCKLDNKVSIALLIERNGKSFLTLGDANPEVVTQNIKKELINRGIEKLKIDVLKLSHHCCYKNVTLDMLSLIDCENYIVSCNGRKANLPNKLAIAKILERNKKRRISSNFYFNYEEVKQALNWSEEDFSIYNFKCFGPNFQNGIQLAI